jgi:hypothetical protein
MERPEVWSGFMWETAIKSMSGIVSKAFSIQVSAVRARDGLQVIQSVHTEYAGKQRGYPLPR